MINSEKLKSIIELADSALRGENFAVVDSKFVKELAMACLEMKESLKFTTKCAEYMNGKRENLLKGLDPMFYHTLTYEGDLEMIGKVEKAKEVLEKYFGEK